MGRIISRQRLLDLAIVAVAAGCGAAGCKQIAQERALQHQPARNTLRSNERLRRLGSISKDGQDEVVIRKREEVLKLRREIQSLSRGVLQQSKDAQAQVQGYKRLLKQRQDIVAEIGDEKLKSLMDRKQQDGLSMAMFLEMEHKNLFSQMEEVERLAKVKEELQTRLEAGDVASGTEKSSDPVQG